MRLARRLLKDYRRLKRWEKTDDVFQGAMLRLHRARHQVTPSSLVAFFRLATLQIRRELIDLARHYYGPEGPAANHASQPVLRADSDTDQPADESLEPGRLAAWSEFHRRAAELPEEERTVFDLSGTRG